jgi:hypothetical protein
LFLGSRGSIKDIDVVVVRHVHSSELGTVRGDSEALETTSTLGEHGASLLLTSDSIPSEDQRNGSTLSGDSPRAVRGHSETHDVIVVVFHLTSGFSSGICSLTTTEEFLGV